MPPKKKDVVVSTVLRFIPTSNGYFTIVPIKNEKPVAIPFQLRRTFEAAMRAVRYKYEYKHPITRETLWRVPLKFHDPVAKQLRDKDLPVDDIHRHIMHVLTKMKVPVPLTPEELRGRLGDAHYEDLMVKQRESVAFFAGRGGSGILGDEMGCGKTRQGLATHKAVLSDPHRDPARVDKRTLVVIGPAILRKGWRKEAIDAKYFEDDDIQLIMTRSEEIDWSKGLAVMSYEASSAFTDFSRAAMVILDESHKVKNPEAKTTNHLFKYVVKKHQVPVLCMSGTPMSRPKDMFTQIKMVDSILVPNRLLPYNGFPGPNFSYGFRYCAPKQVFQGMGRGLQWVCTDSSRLDELNILLERVLVRRTKDQVMTDLPPKNRTNLYVYEDPPDRLEQAFAKIDTVRDKRGNILADSKMMELVRETKDRKKPFVRQYLIDVIIPEMAQHEDWKYLVFAHHLDMIDDIMGVFESRGIDVIQVDGRIRGDKRSNAVSRFQTDPECRVAVLGILAAAAGLNLQSANQVIFTEMSWSPSQLLQAEDRAHRKGQERPVDVRYLMIKNSTDDVLWRSVAKKFRQSARVLDGKTDHLRMNNNASAKRRKINDDVVEDSGDIDI